MSIFRNENPIQYVERKEILGKGSFGAVYKGKVVRDGLSAPVGESVAIKVVNTFNEDLEVVSKELLFLMDLRSPFIVNYIESFLFENELWIVLELCDAGSLLDFRTASGCSFDESSLKAIMAYRYIRILSTIPCCLFHN